MKKIKKRVVFYVWLWYYTIEPWLICSLKIEYKVLNKPPTPGACQALKAVKHAMMDNPNNRKERKENYENFYRNFKPIGNMR